MDATLPHAIRPSDATRSSSGPWARNDRRRLRGRLLERERHRRRRIHRQRNRNERQQLQLVDGRHRRRHRVGRRRRRRRGRSQRYADLRHRARIHRRRLRTVSERQMLRRVRGVCRSGRTGLHRLPPGQRAVRCGRQCRDQLLQHEVLRAERLQRNDHDGRRWRRCRWRWRRRGGRRRRRELSSSVPLGGLSDGCVRRPAHAPPSGGSCLDPSRSRTCRARGRRAPTRRR